MQALLPQGNVFADSAQDGNFKQDETGAVVSRRLKESPFAAVRRLQSDFNDGVLTLFGRVPTYYTKQVALSLACSSPGVGSVIDRIEVR